MPNPSVADVRVWLLSSLRSRPMIRNILCQSAYQLGMCLWLVYAGKDVFGITPDYLLKSGRSPTETEATAYLNTLIFNVFVLCQVRVADCFEHAVLSVRLSASPACL